MIGGNFRSLMLQAMLFKRVYRNIQMQNWINHPIPDNSEAISEE